uniref:Uncharacterized protein n=1 Tax=Rhizophora mucronata TaxID=61149 RepID=A0A2P2NZW9_RHIMU
MSKSARQWKAKDESTLIRLIYAVNHSCTPLSISNNHAKSPGEIPNLLHH